jgi:hypothetical protein
LLPLGHLGIGSRLLGRARARLPAWPLYLGCLLPDLLDKPLYYALSAATGRHGAALGLISSSRTVGHTGLLLLALAGAALLTRSPQLVALAAGDATHLFLDNLPDLFLLGGPLPDSSSLIALVFPALGVRFPIASFTSLAEHFELNVTSPYAIAGELVGGAILLRAALRRPRAQSS